MYRPLLNPYDLNDLPKEIDGLLEHPVKASCMRFNRHGNLLAVGNYAGNVVLWDFDTLSIARTLTPHQPEETQPVTSVSFPAPGNASTVLVTYRSGYVRLFDSLSGRLTFQINLHKNIVDAVPHPKRFNVIVVISTNSHPLLLHIRHGAYHAEPSLYANITDPTRIVSVPRDPSVDLNKPNENVIPCDRSLFPANTFGNNNEAIPSLENPGQSITLSILASSDEFDENGACNDPTQRRKATYSVAFSRGGRCILRGGAAGIVRVFSLSDTNPLKEIEDVAKRKKHASEENDGTPDESKKHVANVENVEKSDATVNTENQGPKEREESKEQSEQEKMAETKAPGEEDHSKSSRGIQQPTSADGQDSATSSVPFPRCFASFVVQGKAVIRSIQISRRFGRVLINSQDRAVRLFHLKELLKVGNKKKVVDPETTYTEIVNKTQCQSACFSGDGEFVIGGMEGTEHRIHVWRAIDGILDMSLEGPREGIVQILWHPLRPVITSLGSNVGCLYIWRKNLTESWSAFAAEFAELEENEEYEEAEDEFDINDADDDDQRLAAREKAEAPDVDIMTMDEERRFFPSDSEPEETFFYIPAEPAKDKKDNCWADKIMQAKLDEAGIVNGYDAEVEDTEDTDGPESDIEFVGAVSRKRDREEREDVGSRFKLARGRGGWQSGYMSEDVVDSGDRENGVANGDLALATGKEGDRGISGDSGRDTERETERETEKESEGDSNRSDKDSDTEREVVEVEGSEELRQKNESDGAEAGHQNGIADSQMNGDVNGDARVVSSSEGVANGNVEG